MLLNLSIKYTLLLCIPYPFFFFFLFFWQNQLTYINNTYVFKYHYCHWALSSLNPIPQLTQPWSSNWHSPPYTVPKHPSPSLRLMTTLSLWISQPSKISNSGRPRSWICWICFSYLQLEEYTRIWCWLFTPLKSSWYIFREINV